MASGKSVQDISPVSYAVLAIALLAGHTLLPWRQVSIKMMVGPAPAPDESDMLPNTQDGCLLERLSAQLLSEVSSCSVTSLPNAQTSRAAATEELHELAQLNQRPYTNSPQWILIPAWSGTIAADTVIAFIVVLFMVLGLVMMALDVSDMSKDEQEAEEIVEGMPPASAKVPGVALLLWLAATVGSLAGLRTIVVHMEPSVISFLLTSLSHLHEAVLWALHEIQRHSCTSDWLLLVPLFAFALGGFLCAGTDVQELECEMIHNDGSTVTWTHCEQSDAVSAN